MIEWMVEIIRTHSENQFTTGGLVVVMFTALLALCRTLPQRGIELIARLCITTVDVADHDQSFYWVQTWLANHEYTKKSKLLTASTRTGLSTDTTTDAKLDIGYSPAPGIHLIRVGNAFVLLNRTRREVDSSFGVAYHESFVLRAFSRTAITSLITEARRAAIPSNVVTVMRSCGWSWKPMSQIHRPFDSVVLPDGVGEMLLRDLAEFQNSEEWYRSVGIPYHRGYLLTGPPGNGKSSLVAAVAGVMQRDIYLLCLGSMGDDSLTSLMSEVPPHSVVVIEDIDCAQTDRLSEKDSSSSNRLTLSGLLNVIDGIGATDGRVLFMTTNHPDALDPALKRAGRVDITIELSDATPSQARRMYLKFFSSATEADATAFADEALATGECSMSDLQERLLKIRSEDR